MKNKIHYSKDARCDLDEIWDYIVSELQNVSAAERIIGHMMDMIEQLRDFAELGAPLSSIADVDSDYRFLVSDSYMVFYRAAGKNVFVDRVLYGRRNYLRILLGDNASKHEAE